MSWNKLDRMVTNFEYECKIHHVDFFLINGSMDQFTVYLTKGKSTLNISFAAKYVNSIVTVYPKRMTTINNRGIPISIVEIILNSVRFEESFSFDACDIKRKNFPFKLTGLEFLNGDDYAQN